MSTDINSVRLQPETMGTQFAAPRKFQPFIKNTPPLPNIDWSLIEQEPPILLDTPYDDLPEADVVIITWANAEWAAMQHVFCSSDASMPYKARSTGYWAGWQKYAKSVPDCFSPNGETWDYWGYYRLVQIKDRKVLLFKSNTHLAWPGEQYLYELINRLIICVNPQLILSIGTAGGARLDDHEGSVNIVRAGTVYVEGEEPSQWPTYSNDWQANWDIINHPNFARLLCPIPTTRSDLESMCEQFDRFSGYTFTLNVLNDCDLDMADPLPLINNLTIEGTPLLTTDTFVVANTSGNFKDFACVEMDDALIGKICAGRQVSFGFVRNISDPAQNAALPSRRAAGDWGSAIYDAYGLYTSYNGALAAWAIVAGQFQQMSP